MDIKAVHSLLKKYPLNKIISLVIIYRSLTLIYGMVRLSISPERPRLHPLMITFALILTIFSFLISSMVAYKLYQNKKSGWIATFLITIPGLVSQIKYFVQFTQTGKSITFQPLLNFVINIAIIIVTFHYIFINKDSNKYLRSESQIEITHPKLHTTLIASLLFVLVLNTTYSLVNFLVNYFGPGTNNIIHMIVATQLSTLVFTLLAFMGNYQKKLWGLFFAAFVSLAYFYYFFLAFYAIKFVMVINFISYLLIATTSFVLILHHYLPKPKN